MSFSSSLPTDLVTPDKAAEILRLSRGTIYHWVRRGYLPHYRVGRLVRLRETDLAAWLERERKASSNSTEFQLT